MKNIKSVLKIILFIAILTIMFQNNIYAEIDTSGVSIGTTMQISSSNNMISQTVGVIQVVGSVAAVLALVIIGLRYMFSSVEEKANMKGVLIYYVVGAILVFATSNILSVAYNLIFKL